MIWMTSRYENDLEWLKMSLESHEGDWLTWEAVNKYRKLAEQLSENNQECIGERRELCEQMMKEYGITELEAVNILNGHHAADYVRKYKRIREQIPLDIKNANQKIVEEEG